MIAETWFRQCPLMIRSYEEAESIEPQVAEPKNQNFGLRDSADLPEQDMNLDEQTFTSIEQRVEVTDYHPAPVTYHMSHVKKLNIIEELAIFGDLKEDPPKDDVTNFRNKRTLLKPSQRI